MAKLFDLAALLLTLTLCIRDEVDASGVSTKITKGRKAKRNEFTFAVWINRHNDFDNLCSGSLVSSQWVLTWYRCVFGTLSHFKVVVGDRKMNSEDGEVEHTVAEMVQFPGNRGADSDMTMVRLDTPADVEERNIGVVQLTDVMPNKTNECYLTSFGYKALTTPHTIKQKLQVRIMDPNACADDPYYFEGETLCYEAKKKASRSRQYACTSDGGAPIVCDMGDGTWRRRARYSE